MCRPAVTAGGSYGCLFECKATRTQNNHQRSPESGDPFHDVSQRRNVCLDISVLRLREVCVSFSFSPKVHLRRRSACCSWQTSKPSSWFKSVQTQTHTHTAGGQVHAWRWTTDLQDQLLDGAGLEGFIRPGLDLDSIPEPACWITPKKTEISRSIHGKG